MFSPVGVGLLELQTQIQDEMPKSNRVVFPIIDREPDLSITRSSGDDIVASETSAYL